jgi:protein transport protein SEC23
MDPVTFEFSTGVRMNIQAIPNCQQSLEALNLPLSIHLSPAKRLESVVLSTETPNKCPCGSYLNPSSVVNFATKTWFCNFCLRSNKLNPAAAQALQPNSLLPEQEPQNLVYEYQLPDAKRGPELTKNTFMLVVDTCLSVENLASLKTGLTEAVEQVDFETTQFVLITYSRNVNIFRGNATKSLSHSIMIPGYFTNDQFVDTLGLKKDTKKEAAANLAVLQRYLFTSLESLSNAIQSIDEDPFETPEDERSNRASGKALEIALELAHLTLLESSRLLYFIGGPCTFSSGRIAEPKISSFIRKHLDVDQKPEIKTQVDLIKKYYSELAQKAVNLKVVIDIVAFSLTEFGLFEMEALPSRTNGVILMNEEFKQEHFAVAIRKYFKPNDVGYSNMAAGATIELFVSKEIKISGCVGNCESQNTKPANQSDSPIGQSNTTRWSVGGLDPESTFLFILEVAEKSKAKGYSKHAKAYFQFVITYKHPVYNGLVRVVSFDRPFVIFDNPLEMLPQIDQFSVISTYAKLAALRVFDYDNTTMIRYLDKVLIAVLKTYRQNGEIPEEVGLVAQYFYYLRKSNFVKKFATSLDEMTFYKHSVLRENIDNTLIIVQPQIIEYSLTNEEPKPVLPDLSCLKKEVILLADTFFNIIIWKGAVIKGWVDEGYHLQPDYSHVAELLKQPEDDFAVISEERIVAPAKIYAHSGSPTERFLKSRLNPESSVGASSDGQTAAEEGNFATEDASLSVFMARLLEYIREPQK